ECDVVEKDLELKLQPRPSAISMDSPSHSFPPSRLRSGMTAPVVFGDSDGAVDAVFGNFGPWGSAIAPPVDNMSLDIFTDGSKSPGLPGCLAAREPDPDSEEAIALDAPDERSRAGAERKEEVRSVLGKAGQVGTAAPVGWGVCVGDDTFNVLFGSVRGEEELTRREASKFLLAGGPL